MDSHKHQATWEYRWAVQWTGYKWVFPHARVEHWWTLITERYREYLWVCRKAGKELPKMLFAVGRTRCWLWFSLLICLKAKYSIHSICSGGIYRANPSLWLNIFIYIIWTLPGSLSFALEVRESQRR